MLAIGRNGQPTVAYKYIISGTNNVHKIKNVLRKQRRTVNTT